MEILSLWCCRQGPKLQPETKLCQAILAEKRGVIPRFGLDVFAMRPARLTSKRSVFVMLKASVDTSRSDLLNAVHVFRNEASILK